jgi:hypothetical protein
VRDRIVNAYPDDTFMFALGFDEAIIGVEQFTLKVVYSEKKCIDILKQKGLDPKVASDHFEFNIKSAYMGDKTPIFVDDILQ